MEQIDGCPNLKRRIRELENQNAKFRALLHSTLEVTDQDSEKILKLQEESINLRGILEGLENERDILEGEIEKVYCVKYPELGERIHSLEAENGELKNKLKTFLEIYFQDSTEIAELRKDEQELKVLMAKLEVERQLLVRDLKVLREQTMENCCALSLGLNLVKMDLDEAERKNIVENIEDQATGSDISDLQLENKIEADLSVQTDEKYSHQLNYVEEVVPLINSNTPPSISDNDQTTDYLDVEESIKEIHSKNFTEKDVLEPKKTNDIQNQD